MSIVEYGIEFVVIDEQFEEYVVESVEIDQIRLLLCILIYVFCESEDVFCLMDCCSCDCCMVKVIFKINYGSIVVVVSMFVIVVMLNLIILEIGFGVDCLFEEFGLLVEVCDFLICVIVIGW